MSFNKLESIDDYLEALGYSQSEILQNVQDMEGGNFYFPYENVKIRWKAASIFFREKLDTNFSYQGTGSKKVSIHTDDFTRYFNDGSVIKSRPVIDVQKNISLNLIPETNEHTGVYKSGNIMIFEEYVPNVFLNYIQNDYQDLSKFDWSKFDIDSTVNEIMEFYNYKNSLTDEEIEERDTLRHQSLKETLYKDIENKIKPRGQYKDFDFAYEIQNIVGGDDDVPERNFELIKFVYKEDNYYILVESDNDNNFISIAINKPLNIQEDFKEKGKKGFFKTLFS